MKGDRRLWFHGLLRTWLRWSVLAFYRSVQLEGTEHIPRKGPVILAGNHNNAVMDVLVIVPFLKRTPRYLSRSDVFRNPILRKFFSQLGMSPVYRLRDGVDIRTMNEPVFDQMADALEAGESILIFPEGDKGKDYNLLPLKKGMARIAFRALARQGCAEVPVVPVGITYEWMYRPGARVVVRFGKPVMASAFRTGDEQQDLRQLTDAVASTLRPLMYHLPAEQVPAIQQAVEAMDSYRPFAGQLSEAYTAISSGRIAPDFAPSKRKPWLSLLWAPVRYLARLLHLPPYGLALWLTARLCRHPHFYSSILFGFLLVLVPLWWVLVAVIALCFA